MSQGLLRNYLYEKNKRASTYEHELQALERDLAEVLAKYPGLTHTEKSQAVETILTQEQELCEPTEEPEYEPAMDDAYGVEDRITYSQQKDMLQRSRNRILNNYWDERSRR